MASRLGGEAEERIARADRAADQRVRSADEQARVAVVERDAARGAERELAGELGVAQQARRVAVLHAHALALRVGELLPQRPARFGAWIHFPGESYEALAAAAAAGVAGGQLEGQITAAPAGVTRLVLGEGILEVDRRGAGRAQEIALSYSRPLDCSEPGVGFGAYLRVAVSAWQEPRQAGVLIEADVIDAPVVMPLGELAGITGRLLQAATPDADAGWPIGSHATRIGLGEVDQLVAFLRSGERARPVLVLTGVGRGGTADHAEPVAGALCGAAHVVTLTTPAVTQLRDRLTWALSVGNGQARCYRPGFGDQSNAQRHPCLNSNDYRTAEQLQNALVLLACGPEQLDERVTASAGRVPRAAGRVPAARTPASQVSDEQLRRELAEERQRGGMLAAALAAGNQPGQLTRASLRNVVEAATLAREHTKHLSFAAGAMRSAAESPYQPAVDVYDALMLLDKLAGAYTAGQIGMDLRLRARQLGLTWRADISSAARGKHREDYTCTYQDAILELGPHLIIANGTGAARNCRIYLHVSGGGSGGPPRGIYVGHIGRHLPDSTT